MNRLDIADAPEDIDVIFGFDFEQLDWPVVIVGEKIKFGDKTHYLWKGLYEDVIKLLQQEGYIPKNSDPIPSWYSLIT